MNNTKEKQSKLQIIISVLSLTVVLFAEMYLMINFKEAYVAIVVLAIIALIAVYVMINAYIMIDEIKEVKRNEHLENLYKSDKASYIMLKKSFAEMEDKLKELQEASKLSEEEIITAQKGTAKVIISRSKENAESIINSNNQVLDKLQMIEESQKKTLTDVVTQTEIKMQDLVVQLKDTELRLNQSIMSGTKVVMSAPVSYEPESIPVEPVIEEIPVIEDIPVIEETPVVEEPAVEEEKPPMPDLSDPNKMMSPDEIAALLANL